MAGTLLVWISFLAAALSSYAYYRSATSDQGLLKVARNSFGVMVIGVLAASAVLMMYILRHQFEYEYVWSYSSRALPLHLLITTFWAGQEGSFLFWALCGSVIGLVLMAYTRRKRIEFETMTIYALVQSFLLLLLIVKSPFQYVWDANPGRFAAGMIPADGRGLNPLLQNIWMIIHPPVLFIGFAAMAVPFVFALAALWRKSYGEWVSNAVPWVIFGTIALGAGIILGGYWAYGVLGWGGWWGWDPVENSSLIPWLIGIILLHTMVVQRRTGGLARTNFFLAISTYVLVVYSTFLTRSGVLGDSSVHSFVDPGALAYTLLIAWIGASILLGFGMIGRRWKDLKMSSLQTTLFTRESILAISCIVMGVSALVILFGTSWPILSHASLEPAFYNKTNLPIAIVLGLLLGFSLLVQWKTGSLKELLRNSVLSLSGAGVVLIVLIWFGLHDLVMGILAYVSLFAFFVNIFRVYQLAKESVWYIGGAVAHIGLAFLFLGIIGSGRYGQKETASLSLNGSKEVLGYKLTYKGSQPTDDGKWKLDVQVERGSTTFLLEPVMFESSYNNSVMRNPDYASFITGDFYLEPVSVEEVAANTDTRAENTVQLKKGESRTIGDVEVTFLRFQMNQQAAQSMTGSGGFAVGAVLEVRRGKRTEEVLPVAVYKAGQRSQSQIVKTKDGLVGFELLGMNVDAETRMSTIQVGITGLRGQVPVAQKSEVLIVEASVKPFIGLVWTGAVLMISGLVISLLAKLNGKGRAKQTRDQRKSDGDFDVAVRSRDAHKLVEEAAEKGEG
jgi:cytochrome c-type biogenesis protein CcmF